MQFLGILFAFIALSIAVPFAGGGYTPSRLIRFDYQSDINASLIEAFSRAAWAAGRVQGAGTINRGIMTLPSGFSDDPNHPYQAWSDGSYVYVWSNNTDPAALRTNAPFAGFQASDVQVGIAGPSTIQWRDGSASMTPSNVSSQSLVIRMHL